MPLQAFTLEQLAKMSAAKLIGDPHHRIFNVESLEDAEDSDISFFSNPRYEAAMHRTKAGGVFITLEVWEEKFSVEPRGRNFLLVADPSAAFQIAVEAFHGRKNLFSGFSGIHSTAVIHPTAKLSEGVAVGPYAVIDSDVVIGANTVIGTGSYVGPQSVIGADSLLHPHVVVRERCKIGDRVILQPGVVIGSCGFGYIADAQGRHQKLKQLGSVTIADDVEVGANTTIDRARFKCTLIGRGSKLDNLVQIGHGVKVGEDNVIIAQTGIAGSTSTGNHVILAGHVAVAGHLRLADHVVVAGCSGVSRSITSSGRYGGIPAQPLGKYNRNAVHLRQIDKTLAKIKRLEERVERLINMSMEREL